MAKVPRNTRKKLHAARVRAEKEDKGTSKAERRAQRALDAEWDEAMRGLKGVNLDRLGDL